MPTEKKGKPQEPVKLYTKKHLTQARRAMLRELASFSGGKLIMGCCTQGCCDPEAQEFYVKVS